jgi:transposase InsO family protein
MILGLLDETVAAGASQQATCQLIGLDVRTVQRWRRQEIGDDRRAGPRQVPANALSSAERAELLRVATSPEYRDRSPKQIVPLLADEGRYLASESSLYRVLRAADAVRHRANTREPSKRHRPDPCTASGPNEVWSWDITYLASTVRGSFFRAYMILDVWSRKIVGFAVHDDETAAHAADLIEETCESEQVARRTLVLHSDNGSPMKGGTMLAKLDALGVRASFSRPSVSNDNPYSESLFRTAKTRAELPSGPFEDLDAARAWAAAFVRWYNETHLHSSIRFVTPAGRHAGADATILDARARVYAAARLKRPDRWSGGCRSWSPIRQVTLNPVHEDLMAG